MATTQEAKPLEEHKSAKKPTKAEKNGHGLATTRSAIKFFRAKKKALLREAKLVDRLIKQTEKLS